MKKGHLHFCNILEAGPGLGHLWQFTAGNNQVVLATQQTIPPGQPAPPKLVAKDWKTLWQKKLNVAWLPADQIFLRVIHLPASDFSELVSMVEFQLEKLSPLPVAQIVWSVEVLPQHAENLQTALVIIAERRWVEELLGQLETRGYLPDRLELPFIQQLLTTPIDEDGAWIYPTTEAGQNLCFVAWWYGGVLQQLQLFHLPSSGEQTANLIEQLTKTAWAGEMEGWLTSPAKWRLVADSETAASWEPALTQWAGEPIKVLDPLSKSTAAEFTAKRAARGGAAANLLPPERAARYQQQFTDRLWMTGLGAVVAAYLLGVMAYFAGLQVIQYQYRHLEREVAMLSPQYTNAVRLKEQNDVLQNQLNLKYAALDSLRAASELLPAELTLNRFTFTRGQTLRLEGTAPQDQSTQVTAYNSNLRKATVNGEPLFRSVAQPSWSTRGQQIAWFINCDLNSPGPE